jgi:hypothetical protein
MTARKRMEELQEWLLFNAPECRAEQKHLDEGTAERAYWHFRETPSGEEIYGQPRQAKPREEKTKEKGNQVGEQAG